MNQGNLTSIILLVLAAAICALAKPPDFPIKEICAAYKDKCVNKFNRNDCDSRVIECEKYALQGITTTWNFCMFSHNDDLTICHDRIQTDFQIIKSWIAKDQFKYLPE